MQKLIHKSCSDNASALTSSQIEEFLTHVNGWQLSNDGEWLTKSFQFENFYHAMGFVNALAWIANRENHHPDLEIGYNYCHVRFQTHTVKRVSENDFICASKIDAIGE